MELCRETIREFSRRYQSTHKNTTNKNVKSKNCYHNQPTQVECIKHIEFKFRLIWSFKFYDILEICNAEDL